MGIRAYLGALITADVTDYGKPRSGTKAFHERTIAKVNKGASRNAFWSLGIYANRPVRGGITPSVHRNGRAGDLGHAVGEPLVEFVAEQLRLLGPGLYDIERIVTKGRIWTIDKDDKGWRFYKGLNRHKDHIHYEMGLPSADTLTAASMDKIEADFEAFVKALQP
jgi:hypothetical protein